MENMFWKCVGTLVEASNDCDSCDTEVPLSMLCVRLKLLSFAPVATQPFFGWYVVGCCFHWSSPTFYWRRTRFFQSVPFQYVVDSRQMNFCFMQESLEACFSAIVRWTHHDVVKRQSHFAKLFSHLDLSVVSRTFLNQIIRSEVLICLRINWMNWK